MKNKNNYIFIIILLYLSVFIFNGCGSSELFVEEKLKTEGYNPEMESYGGLFLDENNELSCFCYTDNVGTSASMSQTPQKYNIVKDKYYVFDIPTEITNPANSIGYQNVIASQDGMKIYIYQESLSFKTTLIGFSKDNEIIFELNISDIYGAENIIKNSNFGCSYYLLENGNVGIVGQSYDREYNSVSEVAQINPYTKELVSLIKIKGDNYISKAMVDGKVFIYSFITNDILIYDIMTGEKLNELRHQGDQKFASLPNFGAISVYEGYVYTFNEKGIYRADIESGDFELIINSSDTKYINSKITLFSDILVESENVIYITIHSDFNEDGTSAKVSFIKFDLSKINYEE